MEERQLGALVSPGRLSQPHATLEGIRSCDKCHEAGERVTAAKCLSCHTPIADRIRAKRGVHRAVQGDCVTCHAEHQGTAGELRPFDTTGFDHAREAGYPLDGLHAPLGAKCASCHKTRSYLGVSTACATCHTDTHKGALGNRCETCHTTKTVFKQVSQNFDHSKAAFPLEGAHQKVACESCHKNQQFKGVAFATCNRGACHLRAWTPGVETSGAMDPHTPAGKSEWVVIEQNRTTAHDNTGTCMFIGGSGAPLFGRGGYGLTLPVGLTARPATTATQDCELLQPDVLSLMTRPVYEPGKMAHWIAPPKQGIKGRPADFVYVRHDPA